MAIDIETVTLQGTYRIGFRPPAERSLAAGELYIEVGSGAPKLWVGAMQDAGLVGNMAVFATAEAAPPAAPVNRDIPAVLQEGAVLTCTMGSWDGEPTGYAYQWKLDGATDVGDGSATYTFAPGDVGHVAGCVVSATNAAGTTAAPPSNQVLIAPVGTELTSAGIPIRPEERNPPPPPSVEEQPKPENEPKPHRGR